MCGFIAQLVEHRTGIAEVTGSNPVEALIFFRLLLSNCLNWKIYCDDHISLSFLFLFLNLISFLIFFSIFFGREHSRDKSVKFSLFHDLALINHLRYFINV